MWEIGGLKKKWSLESKTWQEIPCSAVVHTVHNLQRLGIPHLPTPTDVVLILVYVICWGGPQKSRTLHIRNATIKVLHLRFKKKISIILVPAPRASSNAKQKSNSSNTTLLTPYLNASEGRLAPQEPTKNRDQLAEMKSFNKTTTQIATFQEL